MSALETSLAMTKSQPFRSKDGDVRFSDPFFYCIVHFLSRLDWDKIDTIWDI